MLYIVLALVVAAFGLLIAALTTANTLWAWISVVISVVAATLLVTDWVKGRRQSRAGQPARPSVVTVGGARRRDESAGRPADDERPAERDDAFDDTFGDDLGGTFERDGLPDDPRRDGSPARTAHDHRADRHGDLPDDLPDDRGPVAEQEPGAGEAERTGVMEPVAPPEAGEPGEEPTDASDLLVVAGLSVEVRVVDEHPRYHLATCVWLANRPTIPVPVAEARQLGFTPCARCGPDSVLAARHRAAR